MARKIEKNCLNSDKNFVYELTAAPGAFRPIFYSILSYDSVKGQISKNGVLPARFGFGAASV